MYFFVFNLFINFRLANATGRWKLISSHRDYHLAARGFGLQLPSSGRTGQSIYSPSIQFLLMKTFSYTTTRRIPPNRMRTTTTKTTLPTITKMVRTTTKRTTTTMKETTNGTDQENSLPIPIPYHIRRVEKSYTFLLSCALCRQLSFAALRAATIETLILRASS